ncbi:hypothetical protein Clacol_004833 [Clathrus columnatus]|uniref:BHLH domain-containing protein n=1 Tax=Clathrus columnatus TaxID=1419009 RepID=A0AAV5A7K1_9AGAM|nr:hypothetical protein Clacol_004833 [Clathrus columnatus]
MAYFSNSQPKVRQEGFDIQPQHRPPSPSQFDPNNAMFFGHHLYNNNVKPHPPTDFADDLAAIMATSNHDAIPRPHNPFDTSATTNSYRTHNIFDVSSPAPFPNHFSLPTTGGGGPPGPTFDTSYSNFRGHSRSRSRSKVDNSNNGGRVQRHKRGSISSSSPRPISPPPSHHHSSSHHSRPQAILIPPTNGSSHHHQQQHHHPVSPLSLHMHPHTAPSAWFIDSQFRGGSGTNNGTPGDSFRTTDSPFSLPTPDSIPVHHSFSGPGSLPAASPKSVSAKESPPPPQTQDAAAKQAQLASEKRRRRRESHNAVERRRRDNINEKISELATLIPECMLDPNTGSPAAMTDPAEAFIPDAEDKKDAANSAAAGGPVKANKGMILRKSVEYIRYLQQLVNAQATRNRELEVQLASKSGFNGNGSAVTSSDPPSPSTSDQKSENKDDTPSSSSKEIKGTGGLSDGTNGVTGEKGQTGSTNPNSNGRFDVNVGIGPNGEFNVGDMNMNMGMNMGIMHNIGIGMNLNMLMGMDMFGQQHSGGIGLMDDPMEGDEEELEEQDGDDRSHDLDNDNDAEGSSHGHSSASPNELDTANKTRQHARRRSDAIPNSNGTLFGDEEERGRRRVRRGTKEIRVKTEEPHDEEGDMGMEE